MHSNTTSECPTNKKLIVYMLKFEIIEKLGSVDSLGVVNGC
jgi:hypothetical protein